MRTRPITALAAALALLATVPVTARAQEPTSTPTPTASPTATPTASSADAKKDWPKDVQRVYDDYRRDGVIDVCEHTQATLQKTLDTIEPAYDQDYPDFREAISAGIQKHTSGGCGSEGSSGAGAGAGATPTPTPTPTATPTPADGGGSGAESGALPPSSDGGSSSGSGAVPPEDDIPPQASATPVPSAAPPAAAPPAAVAPPAATPQPVIVHAGHRSLTLPIALIALALLGAFALALSAFAARRNPRLAHAWREAAFRTRGTWADFSDWLRLGR